MFIDNPSSNSHTRQIRCSELINLLSLSTFFWSRPSHWISSQSPSPTHLAFRDGILLPSLLPACTRSSSSRAGSIQHSPEWHTTHTAPHTHVSSSALTIPRTWNHVNPPIHSSNIPTPFFLGYATKRSIISSIHLPRFRPCSVILPLISLDQSHLINLSPLTIITSDHSSTLRLPTDARKISSIFRRVVPSS